MADLILASTLNEKINGTYLSWCYFHGELEESLGYDLIQITPDSPLQLYDLCYDTIYNVSVVGFENRPATMFYWKRELFEKAGALVVFNDDIQGYKYAKEKFEEKAEMF